MRTSLCRYFVIALILPTFFLCLWKARAKTLLLDDADDNSHLCLYVGDTFSIKLVSNPTTGYGWAKPEGLTHLQLLSSQSESGSLSSPGASGFQVLSFKAIETGNATLTLNYLRPFEKNKPPAKTYHLSLTITARPTSKAEAATKPDNAEKP